MSTQCLVKAFFAYNSYLYGGTQYHCIYANNDGTTGGGSYNSGNFTTELPVLLAGSEIFRSFTQTAYQGYPGYTVTITVDKDGYYLQFGGEMSQINPTFYHAGDSLPRNTFTGLGQAGGVMYLGMSIS